MKRRADQSPSSFDPAIELEAFAKTEKLKYQQIPGLAQDSASDRSYLNEIIFRDDLAGKSVFDIGSNLGYFCIEALRRGAAEAIGIDPDAENIRKANRIAELSRLRPAYIQADFESHDWGEQKFDIILCLNVLHHMFDPVHALRKMMRLARDRVIIEFAVPRLTDVLRGKLSLSALPGLFGPSIVLGEPKYYSDGSRTFLFTEKAMRILFNKHHAVFEPVQITRSPFKGRLILEARRRKIDHLVVIAGPTASGKSTLIEKLRSDPALRQKFSMQDALWPVCNAGSMQLPPGRVESAIFHFDLLRPFGRSLRTIDRDISIELMKTADRVNIFTLIASPETMRQRLLKEMSEKGKNRRHRNIYDSYRSPGFVEQWYEQWFHVCDELTPRPEQKLVTSQVNGGYELHDMTCFKSLLETIGVR